MSNPRTLEAGIRDVTFGERVTIVRPAKTYEGRIGDDCFIGRFVEVQRGVVVGRKTRIQSHAFVCELVTIGEECFIGHGVMFINDAMRSGRPTFDPRAGVWKETRIGNRVSIGSNATILPVSVCDDVLIGAGAVVTRDIRKAGVYAGNPARLLRRAPSSAGQR